MNLSPRPPPLRDHIFMASRVVLQDRFYCILMGPVCHRTVKSPSAWTGCPLLYFNDPLSCSDNTWLGLKLSEVLNAARALL